MSGPPPNSESWEGVDRLVQADDRLRAWKKKIVIREGLFQREMHPIAPTPDRPLTTHTGDPRNDPTHPR